MALFSNVVHAQDKYTGEGSFDIWNTNIDTSGQGETAYTFTIDTHNLPPNDIKEITNLLIETNIGAIKFNEPIKISEATRYSTGVLQSKEMVSEIQIIKVVGAIDGKMVDLTNQLTVRELNAVKLITSTTGKGQAGCPEKVINSGTETGVFVAAECGDFCHITVKRDGDGKETDFLAGGDAQEFDAKPGTKVMYDYEYIQTFLFVDNPDYGECSKSLIINSIKAVK
jgi:hypothetical protein